MNVLLTTRRPRRDMRLAVQSQTLGAEVRA